MAPDEYGSPTGPRGTASARDGDTEDLLPEREVQFQPTIHSTHRRPLGVGPAPLLGGFAAVTFVLGLLLLALGSSVAGVVILGSSAIAASLFVVAARHEPEALSARLAVGAADRADGIARLIMVSTRAWSRTGVELVGIWHRRRRLGAQFKRQLTPLGEAVYRDDLARAAQLTARAHELEQALREADRLASRKVAALHDEIERERLPRQHTQRLPVANKGPSSQS